jgi:hypothetical protein
MVTFEAADWILFCICVYDEDDKFECILVICMDCIWMHYETMNFNRKFSERGYASLVLVERRHRRGWCIYAWQNVHSTSTIKFAVICIYGMQGFGNGLPNKFLRNGMCEAPKHQSSHKSDLCILGSYTELTTITLHNLGSLDACLSLLDFLVLQTWKAITNLFSKKTTTS